MSEAAITEAILRLLRTIPESKWSKNHGSPYGERGRPDIQGTIRDSYEPPEPGSLHRLHCLGRTFAFEVKTEKGRLTSWQVKALAELKAAGAVAEVVRTVRDVENVLALHGIRTAPRVEVRSFEPGVRLTPGSLRKLLNSAAPSARPAPRPGSSRPRRRKPLASVR